MTSSENYVSNEVNDLREKFISFFLDESGIDKDALKKTLERLVELNDPWGKHHLGASYEKGFIGEVDQEKANSFFLSAAQDGFADSQMAIGNNLLMGLGINKNTDEAIKWLEKAASQDNAYSNYLLASIYLYRFADKKNIKLGLEYLKKAIDLGDERAQTEMAEILYSGSFVPKDIPRSIELFTKAADKGFEEAAYDLAKIYQDGEHVNQDYEKCVHYLSIAADRDHMRGLHDLGTMYFNGLGVEKDVKKAHDLYLKAVNFGSNLSSYCLGLIYQEGILDKPMPLMALFWFLIAEAQGNEDASQRIYEITSTLTLDEECKEKIEAGLFPLAEEKNFVWAQLAIADLYMKGDLLDKDLFKAAHFYGLAAENQNDKAQSKLAYMYINGLGVETDYAKAAALFTKSAERNNPDATNDLGNMYRYGLFFEKDMVKAKELFERAAELNSPNAMYTMSLFYSDGSFTQGVNEKKAMDYLISAVNLKFPPALRDLGMRYEHGDGVEKDLQKSLSLNLEAAALGDIVAKFNLGCLYQFEFNEIEKAEFFYREAANSNYPSAQYNLAMIYAEGLLSKPDYEQAENWYKLAIEQGHYGAMANLARLYLEGHPRKDLKAAANLMEKSANYGDSIAQYNLGILYRDGIGLESSLEKAIHWFELSAVQGFPQAQLDLSLCLIIDKNPKVNNIEGLKWALLAQKNHEPRAAEIIEYLENKMTINEINEARKRTESLIQ